MSCATDKKMIETVISESQQAIYKKEYIPLSPKTPRSLHRSRVMAAVDIQRWVRGHQARVSCRKQKDINFKQMRKFRRMLSVAYGKLRTKRIK
jgi:hypothetical protein